MDSIFKIGDKVWFTYEFEGKPYESRGIIDEVYYFNDVRKHKYKIISDASGKPFYIWEDKISFYKKEDRDKLRCVDCKYNKDVISIGRCESCVCSHRLFAPIESYSIKKLEEAYSKAEAMCDNSEQERVCRTCKNRECGLDYKPCVICKDHDMWLPTKAKVNPFKLGDLVMYKDASKPETFTVIDIIEFKDPAGNTAYSYKIKRTNINNPNSDTIVHIVDHNRLVKVQFKGGYEYQRGDYVRFEYDGFIKVGKVIELLYADTDRGAFYKIRGKDTGNEYIVNQDKIKGLYGNPDFNGFYGNTDDFKKKKHDDAADSLSYSLKRKLDKVHSNAVYGLNIDQTFYDDILKYVNEDKMSINDIRKMIGMEPIKEGNKMKKEQKKRNRNIIKTEKGQRTIKDITFNGPAVIVKFEPTGDDLAWGRFKGDKVVVVCKDGDKYDMKTGFLLAILKEFLNNQSYGNVLEKLDSLDALDIPQVGKEWKENIINPDADKVDDWKFMIGDLVRLKSGKVIFKVVRTCTWKFGDRIVHRYAIQRLGGSKYITYENENRLTLVEPTTGRLMKSIIKE